MYIAHVNGYAHVKFAPDGGTTAVVAHALEAAVPTHPRSKGRVDLGAIHASGAPTLNLTAFERQTSLRTQVTDALRRALIAGEMQPGRLYSAPALAEALGVSPTPVREAMQDLAKEGLVEAVRNRGFLVTSLTDSDYADLTELRILIEVPTVGKIAHQVPTEDIEGLRPLIVEIIRAAEEFDLVEFVRLDRIFHLELLALAGNRFLVEVVGDLRNRSRLTLLQSKNARRDVLVRVAAEHTELLDLLLARKAAQAESLMRSHIIGHAWTADADDRPA